MSKKVQGKYITSLSAYEISKELATTVFNENKIKKIRIDENKEEMLGKYGREVFELSDDELEDYVTSQPVVDDTDIKDRDIKLYSKKKDYVCFKTLEKEPLTYDKYNIKKQMSIILTKLDKFTTLMRKQREAKR